MVKRFTIFGIALAFVGSLFGFQPEPEVLDAPKLKTLIDGLGYTTTVLNAEPGKEKYQFTVTRSDFNVPIGAEVAPSKNYIWLTAFLGENSTKVKHDQLLIQNGKTQPAFFYITSQNKLMMGYPIDNRGVSPAVLKRIIEKLSSDVASTSTYWQTN